MDRVISKRIELKAAPSKVWEALTDYTQFGQWFGVKLTGPFVPGGNHARKDHPYGVRTCHV